MKEEEKAQREEEKQGSTRLLSKADKKFLRKLHKSLNSSFQLICELSDNKELSKQVDETKNAEALPVKDAALETYKLIKKIEFCLYYDAIEEEKNRDRKNHLTI